MKQERTAIKRCVFSSLFGFYLGRFADSLEGFEEGRNVGFTRVESDGDGFCLEVADNILDAFLPGYILHDFIAASLAMQIARQNNRLTVGSLPADHSRLLVVVLRTECSRHEEV